jgi:hypothetical protein
VTEAGALEAYFAKKPETRAIFEHNLNMIGFEDLTETWGQVTFSAPARQNDNLRSRMQNLDIMSLTSDKTWPKWIASFDRLWIKFPSQAA